MTKIQSTLVILSLLSISARNVEAQDMMIGARIGSNLADQEIVPGSVNFNETLSTSMHAGLIAGGQFDSKVWGSLWVSTQLLIDQKGSHQGFTNSFEDQVSQQAVSVVGTRNLTMNYLEMPFLLKFNVGEGDFQPYIFAGPSLGIFLWSSESYSYISTMNGQNTPGGGTYSARIHGVFDISALFGGGVSRKITSGRLLFVDAGYSIGGQKIFNGNAYVTSRDIRVAAGILFPLG